MSIGDDDLDLFFDEDDFAVPATITNPDDDDFEDLDISVNFNATTEQVGIYDTNVEAPNPSFRCKTSDLANVKRKYVATIASNAYIVERMEAVGDGKTSIVYLKQ